VIDYLFVYGTLRSAFENRHAVQLRTEAQLVGPATVRGSIFGLGSYPGYRPEPDGEVHGEVYRLTDAAPLLAFFDDYEGSDYTRVRVQVSTGQCSGELTWIYQYNGQPPLHSRIPSGDFVAE